MAVAFDAQVATPTDVTAASFSNNTLTIGAIANAVLLVYLSWSTAPGAVTVAWNSVGCTLIGSQATSDGAVSQMYGLIAPATGNKTLAVTSGNSTELIMTAGSFSGADQGAVATTFRNVTSAALSTANPSTVVTSAVGNFTAAMMTTKSGVPSGNKTSFTGYPFSGAGAVNSDAQRTTGAATVTYTWTHGATAWATMACDIAAFGTVGSSLVVPSYVGKGWNPGLTPLNAARFYSPVTKGFTPITTPTSFRKTLSSFGSRTGGRQVHNS